MAQSRLHGFALLNSQDVGPTYECNKASVASSSLWPPVGSCDDTEQRSDCLTISFDEGQELCPKGAGRGCSRRRDR